MKLPLRSLNRSKRPSGQERYFRVRPPRGSIRWPAGTAAVGALTLFAGLLAGVLVGVITERAMGTDTQTGPTYDEVAVTALYEEASPSVVELIVHRPGGTADTGAGFFVDSAGHIVTNSHVLDGSSRIDVLLADGRVLDGSPLGASPSDDLALLSVDPESVSGIRPLPLGDSSSLRTGQLALAIGSPLRMRNFLSVGVVAGIGDSPAVLRDRELAPALQRPIPNMVWTDASLLPGNSGGPLLNSDGEVIGVTSAVQLSARGEFGIGFAIPSNLLVGLLPQLREPDVVSRPWLGVRGTSINRELGEVLGLAVEEGVYVREVIPGTGAARAGLRGDPFQVPTGRGDVIVAVDGRSVATVSELVEYFNTLHPGRQVELTILRRGDEQSLEVTLGAWPALAGG